MSRDAFTEYTAHEYTRPFTWVLRHNDRPQKLNCLCLDKPIPSRECLSFCAAWDDNHSRRNYRPQKLNYLCLDEPKNVVEVITPRVFQSPQLIMIKSWFFKINQSRLDCGSYRVYIFTHRQFHSTVQIFTMYHLFIHDWIVHFHRHFHWTVQICTMYHLFIMSDISRR